jgi:hypothetical protein
MSVGVASVCRRSWTRRPVSASRWAAGHQGVHYAAVLLVSYLPAADRFDLVAERCIWQVAGAVVPDACPQPCGRSLVGSEAAGQQANALARTCSLSRR